MRFLDRRRASLGVSWRIFAAAVAAPALVLAGVGVRAIHADRIQREQQLRQTQLQLGALIDATIATTLARLETDLRRLDDGGPLADVQETFGSATLVRYHQSGLVTYPAARLYFGAFGQHPDERAALVRWPPDVAALIESAQTAEAQHRVTDAIAALRGIKSREPRLRAWTDVVAARLDWRAGREAALALLANPQWSESDGITPSGLPVAFLACAAAESAAAGDREAFAPLVRATISALHAGRWWLSADEWRFYSQWLTKMGAAHQSATAVAADDRLSELGEIDRLVRHSAPSRRPGVTRVVERDDRSTFLFAWLPSSRSEREWSGVALSPERLAALLAPSLDPLVMAHPFSVTIRDAAGVPVWPLGRPPAAAWQVQSLRSLSGLELAFGPVARRGALRQEELIWYTLIAVPLLVLMGGIGVIAAMMRREMALTRMQSDFVAAVTHEFKTPITSIRLLLERVAGGRTGSAEATAAYFAAMAQETERLERLVNRVLDAQQIETGHRHYHFVPTSLEDITREVIAHLQPAAAAKRIRVALQADAPIPPVHVDRAAMTDAIENLVDNAIKYSPAGTSVTVELHATAECITVEVADQGIGIEHDEVPRVFEKFYRARSGDLHNVRGTGLGLALVKAAVEAHGGSVGVASEPGVGSRFSLHVPRPVES